MSDPQIIKLKKEIRLLTEYNAQLKLQLEEQTIKIGEMENQNIQMQNRGMYLEEKTKMAANSDQMRILIEKAIIKEREVTNKYKKENILLKEKIDNYEKQLKDNEIFIQKLQLNNSKLQKDLIDFGKKHESQDYISQINRREAEIVKVGEEKEKIVKDWNELCDKMQDVIAENRLLRQIADVPENFGIDISKINLGDRVKIEDYKAKIRILQHDIDDLESERAQLKHRIQFLANSLQVSEPPFHLLSSDQKVEVARFAQNLYEGKENIHTENYDLIKKLKEKDEQIRALESELNGVKLEAGGWRSNKSKNRSIEGDNSQLEEMKKMLKGYQEEMKKIISDKMIMNEEGEGDGRRMNRFLTASTYGGGGSVDDYIEFSRLQLPPVPLIDNRNPGMAPSVAAVYRLNTRVKIQPNTIHELFGIAINEDPDPDALKKESACLQAQMIELLEIEFRRNNDDEYLQTNLKNIYNKLEDLVLIQNEIFKRYMEKNTTSEEDKKIFTKKIEELTENLSVYQKQNRAFQETIDLIQKKSSDQQYIEKLGQQIKDNAILENNLIKLKRQYSALNDEEKRLRDYVEMNDSVCLERDKKLKETIAKLKKWKSTLTLYLKIVNEKLKKSVEKDDYDRIYLENKYLREKNNELMLRDISATREMCLSQTLILKYKDLEESYFLMEEAKYDAEIELNYLKNRLQEIDPNYYNEQKAFRKLINKLASLNMNYEQIKNAFLGMKNYGSVNISNPQNIDNNNVEIKKKSAINNLYDDLSFLKNLTLDNALISKNDFEQCLRNLNINNDELSRTDLVLIYRVLNCSDEDKVDIRIFLKKLEQYSSNEKLEQMNENQLLEEFIRCVQTSNQNLLSTFEFFDTNNNGCITRDEFIYALKQLNFEISDENINKLIFLVSGDMPIDKESNIHKLDSSDTFNYIEFCQLFEQKSKNYLLRKRRTINNKNKITIDWKVNLLTTIYLALQKNHLTIDEALAFRDKTESGFLSYDEFVVFLNSINANLNVENIQKLFTVLDSDNRKLISIPKLKEALNNILLQTEEYQKLNSSYLGSFRDKPDINKQYHLLVEEKKLFNIKLNTLQKKCDELQKSNDYLNKEVQDYSSKNKSCIDKYFNVLQELNKYKEEYAEGISKEKYNEIISINESLDREKTILRIGLNMFRDLYNACNLQIRYMNLNNERNTDELNTYKRAIKELQGESNQNALIGKLYYTILIGRWRESTTWRKYDELIGDFGIIKEENFVLETENRSKTKDLSDLNNLLHDKIIENMKISDKLESYENGLIEFNVNEKDTRPLEELKKLVSMLKEDKKDNTEQILILKKKILSLQNAKDVLENKIDFCENLANNIKFNSRDEYSKKLISMSEDLAQLKLNNTVLKRDNNFERENVNHLQRLNEQLNTGIKELEIQTSDWEKKYRKMEELYRKKDEERQNKIISALEKMKFYDTKEINTLFRNNPLYGSDKNISNVDTLKGIHKSSQFQDQSGDKLDQLNKIIEMKNEEIQRLMKINEDNNILLRNGMPYMNNINAQSIIDNYYGNDNDETKMIAKTAHKTIKTLQDILSQKTQQLNEKNKKIEELQEKLGEENAKNLQRINSLEDNLIDTHEGAMRKLENIIDITNKNLIVKMSREELSLLTLNDLEKLINDKDRAIKTLGIELQAVKEEIDTHKINLSEKNRRIADLENKLQKFKDNDKEEYYKDVIERLQKEIKIKEGMIDEERNNAASQKKFYETQYKQKIKKDEDTRLDNTVYVPEKLIINKEKSELYEKMVDLRKQITNFSKKNKKQTIKIEELEKKIRELEQNLQICKDEKKSILDLQIKDNKRISALLKEKEKHKKKIDELKDEIEKLTQRLSQYEQEISNRNFNASENRQPKRAPSSTKPSAMDKFKKGIATVAKKNLIPQEEKKSEKDSSIGYGANTDEILKKLVYFCLKKNINMKKQLQRYDISKNGRVKEDEFMHAIEELRLGLIEADLKNLVKIAKPKDGGDIIIDDFVEILKNMDKNYKVLMEEQEGVVDKNKKEASKKYDRFENKPYNVDYNVGY